VSRRELVAPLTVQTSVSAVALEEEEVEVEVEVEVEEEEEEEKVEEVEVEEEGGPSEKDWAQGRRRRGEAGEVKDGVVYPLQLTRGGVMMNYRQQKK